MKLNSSEIESVHALLSSAKRIVITNHVNPDGDAMGSAMGLASVLKQKGFEVNIIVPNAFPNFLKWLPNVDDVVVYHVDEKRATNLINKADLIFHLDYNALKRSGDLEAVLTTAKAKRIMIDHHQQPDDFVDFMYSDTSMSSTCEMVYHFIEALGWADCITEDEANSLYTGMVTDTGNFRFSATTPTTLEVAASLLRKGVKPHEITSKIYDVNTVSRLKLLSKTLENMEVLPQYHTAILFLSKEELAAHGFVKGDTEGFVNYGLSMTGMRFSVFMSEKDGLIKISFRSKGNFDVNTLARKHFDGGGHTNAAGAAVDLSLADAIKKLKDVLPEYEDELS